MIDALQAQHTGRCLSLDAPAGDRHRVDQNRFDDTLSQLDPELGLVEDRELLIPLLAGLSDRNRQILLLRFVNGMTQTEIAGRIGVSQMQISRLLAAILTRLRGQVNRVPARPGSADPASSRSRS